MSTLLTGTKYGNARAQAAPRPVQTSAPQAKPAAKTPSLFIPKLGKTDGVMWQDWFWKELREGGRLHAYLQREKSTSRRRMRAVARRMHGVQHKTKLDMEFRAAVPAREFFRWRAQDKDFWADDSNLKRWRRDNPDAVVKI